MGLNQWVGNTMKCSVAKMQPDYAAVDPRWPQLKKRSAFDEPSDGAEPAVPVAER
jgi:hypothetical protein